MNYRQVLTTDAEMAQWYTDKYRAMNGGWVTPADECNRHLDDALVPDPDNDHDIPDPSLLLLDIGCGGGYLLGQAEKRCICVGCDLSTLAMLEAGERAPRSLVLNYSITHPAWEGYKGKFDRIISLGSLEHIIELDAALDRIRDLLAPDGIWYFYCPNELWVHEDQPNERTATDEEWMELFAKHGLVTEWHERRGDNTAFRGRKG